MEGRGSHQPSRASCSGLLRQGLSWGQRNRSPKGANQEAGVQSPCLRRLTSAGCSVSNPLLLSTCLDRVPVLPICPASPRQYRQTGKLRPEATQLAESDTSGSFHSALMARFITCERDERCGLRGAGARFQGGGAGEMDVGTDMMDGTFCPPPGRASGCLAGPSTTPSLPQDQLAAAP